MAQRTTETEFTLDTAVELAAGESAGVIRGRSPWYLAWRRLRRNYLAFAFLGVFVLVVVACLLAPVYASHVAHTGPNTQHVLDTVKVNGQPTPVVSAGGYIEKKTGKPCTTGGSDCVLLSAIPIGPTWFSAGGKFVLGADSIGRDIAVRLLYGGRTSLIVGIGSSAICVVSAVLLSLLAGYFGGWIDFVIARFFDLFFAFPAVLLGIALGSALAINGFHHFGVNIESGSLWIPTLVISYVLIPYVGRPLRGQVLSLREKEFIEAAISQGASPLRIMFTDLLPNIASSVLVFFTLIIANNIVLEAALSFLGAGVQPPTASWGTLITDGQFLIVSRPWLALAPGIAIVLTVLSLNVFGDGLRDALDPRAKVKIEH
ncbi:MAG TPA: ABC transporter permease [Gaiellaceae bacterium]|nr:ABC transporter permease [Gaiellaceae bacterium]